MQNCPDLYLLSTVAYKLAESVPSNQELALLAASITTLGDMLAVILTHREENGET